MGCHRTMAWRGGVVVDQDFPVAAISDLLDQEGTVVWADFATPEPEELRQLAEELGLHELAVEDAMAEHQRPKVDRYRTHLFLSCHAVSVPDGEPVLAESEIDAFVGPRFLITVRHDEDFDMGRVVSRWERSPDLAGYGVPYLLHGLLDLVVDGYFEVVERFDAYYDEVSESLFADTPLDPSDQRHWFAMRQALVRFHRLAVPMREVVSSLTRHEQSVVPDALYPYYQDIYDHILRVAESTDALRDLITTIVETNLSLRDYRQNQVMKKVTSWAAIIAVPTLITGFYGMNVPYPGYDRSDGLWVAVVLMLVISGGLFALFRRRDWL